MVVGLMLCSSLAGCIFESGSSDEDEEVLAVFSFSPSKNIKVGTTVSFDASSSTPVSYTHLTLPTKVRV